MIWTVAHEDLKQKDHQRSNSQIWVKEKLIMRKRKKEYWEKIDTKTDPWRITVKIKSTTDRIWENKKLITKKRENKYKKKKGGWPSKIWSSGPIEESPQTSQTTLPWISPVQALTQEKNIVIMTNRVSTITTFLFLCASICWMFTDSTVLFSTHLYGGVAGSAFWVRLWWVMGHPFSFF